MSKAARFGRGLYVYRGVYLIIFYIHYYIHVPIYKSANCL